MYMSDIGTKFPFLLHNQPWAALNAAPSEAESVKQVQTLGYQEEFFLQSNSIMSGVIYDNKFMLMLNIDVCGYMG